MCVILPGGTPLAIRSTFTCVLGSGASIIRQPALLMNRGGLMSCGGVGRPFASDWAGSATASLREGLIDIVAEVMVMEDILERYRIRDGIEESSTTLCDSEQCDESWELE